MTTPAIAKSALHAFRPRHDQPRDQRRRQQDQNAERVRTGHAIELHQRRVVDDRCGDQVPRKAAHQIRPRVLDRRPRQRDQQPSPKTRRRRDAVKEHAEQSAVHAEVRAHGDEDQDAGDVRQSAVVRHHPDHPRHHHQPGDGLRKPADRERAAPRPRARQRHEQRQQRDEDQPSGRDVRKGAGEEDAGDDGEDYVDGESQGFRFHHRDVRRGHGEAESARLSRCPPCLRGETRVLTS